MGNGKDMDKSREMSGGNASKVRGLQAPGQWQIQ